MVDDREMDRISSRNDRRKRPLPPDVSNSDFERLREVAAKDVTTLLNEVYTLRGQARLLAEALRIAHDIPSDVPLHAYLLDDGAISITAGIGEFRISRGPR